MIKPTYFLGLGVSGREIINYMKLYNFITTKSHNFHGLFRYGYLDVKYGGSGRELTLLEEIFPEDSYTAVITGTNNDERFDLWDRNTMKDSVGNLTDPVDAFWNKEGKDIQANFNKLRDNVKNAIWRQNISEKIKSTLNLTYSPPISNNVDFFVIGETDDPAVSLFINGLSKKLSHEISLIPYGFLYIDPDSQNGFDALYEIFTSYLPVSVPLFNAIYLYTDEFKDKNVTYFTAARMLILIQSVIDVAGKLIDVDSDYGKGNILLWRLGGAVSRERESKFLSLLRNIMEFLSNVTISSDSVSTEWGEEDNFVEIILESILNEGGNKIKLSKAWNLTEAHRFEKFIQPIWIKEVRNNLWDGENYNGIELRKYGLDFIYYLHKKWEYYFDSQAISLWGDEPLKMAEKFNGEQWEKAFLMSVDSFKKNIISGWEKIFPTDKWNEIILNYIEKIDDLLNKQKKLIGNALKFWCTRGSIFDDGEIVSENDLLDFMRDYESDSKEFVFNKVPNVILELLNRFYTPLQGGGDSFLDGNCVAGALGNIGPSGNLGLKQSGGDKLIFDGWLSESPPGRTEPVIPLDTITKNLYNNLYPGDFYYVRIYTGFGLDDLVWSPNIKRPGKPVYMDKEGERELILMKLLTLILLSFKAEGEKEILLPEVRPEYKKFWIIDSNKEKIYLKATGDQSSSPLTISTNIQDFDSIWDTLHNGIKGHENSIRPLVFNIGQLNARDKEHLKDLFAKSYTGEVNEIGRSIVSKVLKLYNAPYSIESLVNNLEKLVKM